MNSLKTKLETKLSYKVGEIILVFGVAFLFIFLATPFVEGDLILTQAVIWVANVMMLIMVWLGMKIRGEKWEDFGLTLKFQGWKHIWKAFLWSLLVFVLAVFAFAIASVIMANISGMPEKADMSSYTYMKDNLPMFLLTLLGVLIISSFGEEVIYRAFLLNRITQMAVEPEQLMRAAIVISALVFGLVHFDWGPMGIVQTIFMGFVFAVAYFRLKKRLWILIMAHAYMDIILMLQMYFA